MRPPCRQSDNIFDLDDNDSKPKITNRKAIRIIKKQTRPPSRHKTPPKASGVDCLINDINIGTVNYQNVFFSTMPFKLNPKQDRFIDNKTRNRGSFNTCKSQRQSKEMPRGSSAVSKFTDRIPSVKKKLLNKFGMPVSYI